MTPERRLLFMLVQRILLMREMEALMSAPCLWQFSPQHDEFVVPIPTAFYLCLKCGAVDMWDSPPRDRRCGNSLDRSNPNSDLWVRCDSHKFHRYTVPEVLEALEALRLNTSWGQFSPQYKERP